MKKFIAYYRVSTKEQGNSGLGLLAQQQAVKRFIGDNNILVDEFQEVESGTKSDRPQLHNAIKAAKDNCATLVIAKLDRLSRNARFIFTLRDSGVDFVCADMPEANSLTIGLLSVLAEEEAKRTAERTTSALKQIKKKISKGETHISRAGNVVKKLGNPENFTDESRMKGTVATKEAAYNNPDAKRAGAFIISLRNQGMSFLGITNELNKHGFKTVRGKEFHVKQTIRLYERYSNEK